MILTIKMSTNLNTEGQVTTERILSVKDEYVGYKDLKVLKLNKSRLYFRHILSSQQFSFLMLNG